MCVITKHRYLNVFLIAVIVAIGWGQSPQAVGKHFSSSQGFDLRDLRPLTFVVRVDAEVGGIFSNRIEDPTVSVTIPPGALSHDAILWVALTKDRSRLDDNQVVAGPAYRVRLFKAPRWWGFAKRNQGRLTLNAPMKIALKALNPPVHPEIPEIATRFKGRWEGLPANFYRPSSQTVVALSDDLSATYRAVHRALQTASGPEVDRGREVFMDETFGNEDFFGEFLGLHELLNEVPPLAAVGLGVQVDLTRVPQGIVDVMIGDDLDAKAAALQDPAITRALIKAGAVIGVVGFYDDPASDVMSSAGITCALCHVKVENNAFELPEGPMQLPIGAPRFDGVPNSAMDAGAILALTPTAQAAGLSGLLNGWGPGRFDVRALDVPGVDRNPLEDGVDNPTEYPPIWNFLDLSEQGYLIGWDGLFMDNGVDNNALASISEAVYDLIFHGNGAFGIPEFVIDGGDGGTIPPELSLIPPQELVDALVVSERERPGNDLVPPEKLLDMQAFMQSIASPAPDPNAFDEEMAEAGFELFHGAARCAGCHSSADFTGPGLFAITEKPPAGGLAEGVKVPSLRGIRTTAPYFHDGSAPDLAAAVDRLVDSGVVPARTDAERAALVEYLKSL